jgi:hypothetical protein
VTNFATSIEVADQLSGSSSSAPTNGAGFTVTRAGATGTPVTFLTFPASTPGGTSVKVTIF